MKTYLNTKTNERFPAFNSIGSGFNWGGKRSKMYKLGRGWFLINPKEWIGEIIPDLIENYSRQEWIDYATQYGTTCAQEFLNTCDYMKPIEAQRMFNPPKNKEIWEKNSVWFENLFKRSIYDFIDGAMLHLGNTYSIDILKFENYLAYHFSYPKNKDGSMREFMIKTFGKVETDKFVHIFLIR